MIRFTDAAHMSWVSGLQYAIAIICGPWWGAAAAAIATGRTIADWHHPFFFLLEVATTISMGFLVRSGRRVLPSTVITWACAAGPLASVYRYYLGAEWPLLGAVVAADVAGGLLGGGLAHLIVSWRFLGLAPAGVVAEPRRGSAKLELYGLILGSGLLPLVLALNFLESYTRSRDVDRAGNVFSAHARKAVACLDGADSASIPAETIASFPQLSGTESRVTEIPLGPGRKLLWASIRGRAVGLPPLASDEFALPIETSVSRGIAGQADKGLLQLRIAPTTACRIEVIGRPDTEIVMVDELNGKLYGKESVPARDAIRVAEARAAWQAARSKSHVYEFNTRLPGDGRFRLRSYLAASSLSKLGVRVIVYSAMNQIGGSEGADLFRLLLLCSVVATLLVLAGVAEVASRAFLNPLADLDALLADYESSDGPSTGENSPRLSTVPTEVSDLWNRAITLRERTIAALDALREARLSADELAVQRMTFAASASHEIRTQLNIVLGLLPSLRSGGISGAQAKLLDKIDSAGRQLYGTLTLVLDLSTIHSGHWQVQAQAVDIVAIVEASVIPHLSAAKERGLLVETHYMPGVPLTLESDSVRVRQIVSNLIDNAFKFTEAGVIGVRVEWTGPSGQGHIGVLTVEVRDTGCGIADRDQQKVFEAFYRVQREGSGPAPGSGLGLAITQRLTHLLGGTITMESVPGLGTKMSVRIPMVSLASAPSPRGETVAVWGADCAARRCLLRHISYLGFEVTIVTSASDCTGSRIVFIDSAESQSSLVANLLPPGGTLVAYGGSWHAAEGSGQPTVAVPYPPMLSAVLHSISNSPAEATESVARRDMTATGCRSPLILVAEDVPECRFVMKCMFERLGYGVRIVGDGLQAWEALQSETFDIAFLDLRMPEIDGVTLAGMIRESFLFPPFLVALTASGVPDEERNCLGSGFHAFVSKPAEDKIIEGLIRRCHYRPRAVWDIATFNSFRKECGAMYLSMAERILRESEAQLREILLSPMEAGLSGRFHSMAGAALLIGAKQFADALRSLELLAGEDASAVRGEIAKALQIASQTLLDLCVVDQSSSVSVER